MVLHIWLYPVPQRARVPHIAEVEKAHLKVQQQAAETSSKGTHICSKVCTESRCDTWT